MSADTKPTGCLTIMMHCFGYGDSTNWKVVESLSLHL